MKIKIIILALSLLAIPIATEVEVLRWGSFILYFLSGSVPRIMYLYGNETKPLTKKKIVKVMGASFIIAFVVNAYLEAHGLSDRKFYAIPIASFFGELVASTIDDNGSKWFSSLVETFIQKNK